MVSTQAQELIGSELASSIQRLTRAEHSIRDSTDPEVVHQARVATRRIRSTLKIFRPMLDGAWADALRKQLADLADVLGAARDADVMLMRLDEKIATLSARDAKVADQLRTKLESHRGAARDALFTYLDGATFKKVMSALAVAAARPQFSTEAVDASEIVHPAAEAWAELHDAVDELGPTPSSSDLHRVRLLTKRARYAAETGAPFVGDGAARFAMRAAKLQDVLGELQDATIAAEWLRSSSVRSTPRVAYAAGFIAGRETAAAERAKDGWRAVWDRLDRPKQTAWLNGARP